MTAATTSGPVSVRHSTSNGSDFGSWASPGTGPSWGRPGRQVPGPWNTSDVARLTIISGLGVLAASGCWYGGSGAKTFDDTLPWLVGSIASAGLIVAALAAWLIAGFRTVRLMEHEIVRQLLPLLGSLQDRGSEPVPAPSSVLDPAAAGTVAIVPGGSRYHRLDCRMLAGKPGTVLVDEEDAQVLHDLVACGICTP